MEASENGFETYKKLVTNLGNDFSVVTNLEHSPYSTSTVRNKSTTEATVETKKSFDNENNKDKDNISNEVTVASVAQTAAEMTSAMGNKAYSVWSGLWSSVNRQLPDIPSIGVSMLLLFCLPSVPSSHLITIQYIT